MRLGLLFRNDLGFDAYSPMRKEWIATAIGVAGGLLSSFLGGQASSRAAAAAERRQRQREAAEDADYTRKKYEDVGDTAWGQNALRRVEKFNNKNWKRAQGAQAVSGGTDAATQMSKDAGNQLMAETQANMAAQNSARQDRIDAQHQAAQDRFAQMDMNRDMQRAQNISNAAGAASNAIMQMGSAFENSQSLKGGSNQSVSFENPGKAPEVAPTMDSNIQGGELGKMANDTTEAQRLAAKRLIGGY